MPLVGTPFLPPAPSTPFPDVHVAPPKTPPWGVIIGSVSILGQLDPEQAQALA